MVLFLNPTFRRFIRKNRDPEDSGGKIFDKWMETER